MLFYNGIAKPSARALSMTGLPSVNASGWDDVKNSMLEIRAQDRVNVLSAMVAAALLANLQSVGGPPPTSALDPDGDVILTWHEGARKGSAVVAEDKLSAVVTNGARVEYVSPEVNVVDDGSYRLELFSQGVVKWMQQSKGSSPSSTTSMFAEISLPLIWSQRGVGSEVYSGSQMLSNFSREVGAEWNLSSGASTLLLSKL